MKKETLKTVAKCVSASAITVTTMISANYIGTKIGDHYNDLSNKQIDDLEEDVDETVSNKIVNKNAAKTLISSVGVGTILGIIGKKAIELVNDTIDKKF